MKFISHSAKETKKFARQLATSLKNSVGIIALIGELGSGKTIFTQGFAKGLGISEKIISPTFVIIRQHSIPASKKIFYHLDLYRIDQQTDFQNLGIKEVFENPNHFVLVEWADKVESLLPKGSLKVFFQVVSEKKREIKIIKKE